MKKVSSEAVVKDIRRKTRKKYTSVLEGLRGEGSIAGLFVEKAFPPICTTAGAKISWKQAKSVL